jgi:transcriptional regulator with XRE-family HTH domain
VSAELAFAAGTTALRELRLAEGLTQRELAARAGVAPRSISEFEAHPATAALARHETRRRILAALRLPFSIHALVFGTSAARAASRAETRRRRRRVVLLVHPVGERFEARAYLSGQLAPPALGRGSSASRNAAAWQAAAAFLLLGEHLPAEVVEVSFKIVEPWKHNQ